MEPAMIGFIAYTILFALLSFFLYIRKGKKDKMKRSFKAFMVYLVIGATIAAGPTVMPMMFATM